jgi:hypothetical protein
MGVPIEAFLDHLHLESRLAVSTLICKEQPQRWVIDVHTHDRRHRLGVALGEQ